MNAVNQHVADAQDRATNQIFSSGLTLASIVGSQRVDEDVAQRLLDVIDELDRAIRDIRSVALLGAIRDRDTQAVPALATERGRQLARFRDDVVLAYAQPPSIQRRALSKQVVE